MRFYFNVILNRTPGGTHEFEVLEMSIHVTGFHFPISTSLRDAREWAEESFSCQYTNPMVDYVDANSQGQTLQDIAPGEAIELIGEAELSTHKDYHTGEVDEVIECISSDWRKLPADVVDAMFGPPAPDEGIVLLKASCRAEVFNEVRRHHGA